MHSGTRRPLVFALLGAILGQAVGAQSESGLVSRLQLAATEGYASGRLTPVGRTNGGGIAFWFGEHWGLSWSADYGVGDYQWPAQALFLTHVGDDMAVTTGNLFLYRITVRYRHPMAGRVVWIAGGGMMAGRTDSTHLRADTLTNIRTYTVRDGYGQFSVEGLLQVPVRPHLAIQGGLTIDTDVDQVLFLQPVVSLVAGF